MATRTPAALHVPAHPVRFVTAASLFDGHDAAINIMRRILQRQGAEVVHLGHNRSVDEVVAAAIQEDAQGVAISSYQGGHVEYFTYLVELLRERGAGHVKVYGGGGGVIVPAEIELLHSRGVARIFSPEDGQRLGLPGMINMMIRECDVDLAATPPASADAVFAGEHAALARALTLAEAGRLPAELLTARAPAHPVPVLGITGTGGSGKSSLTDELVRRFRLDQEDKLRIAVLAVDPTRRRGGGALLGDRIRMNSLTGENVFFRSMATRGTEGSLPEHLADAIAVLQAAGFDLVIVETPGIGQGDAGIVRVRRPLAVRDDARVRRRVPAREDRHAGLRRRRGDQQVRAPRRRGRPPRRRPPAGAQPGGVRRLLGGHAGLRHQRRHLQRRRRHRALPAPARAAARTTGLTVAEGRLPRTDRKTSTRARRGHPAASAPATWPRSPRPCAATTPRPTSWSTRRARRQHLRTARAALEAARADRGGLDEVLAAAEKALPADVAELLDRSGRPGSRPTPATRWSCRSATPSCTSG